MNQEFEMGPGVYGGMTLRTSRDLKKRVLRYRDWYDTGTRPYE